MIISFALLLLFTIQISNQKPSQEISPNDLSHADTSKDDRKDYIAHHGLRTPDESINQRCLKNWADVADKICCRHT